MKKQQKIGGPLIFEYIKSKKDPLIETNKKGYILYMSRCECGCGGKASKKHMCVRSACGQKPQSATCVRATEKSSHSNTLPVSQILRAKSGMVKLCLVSQVSQNVIITLVTLPFIS